MRDPGDRACARGDGLRSSRPVSPPGVNGPGARRIFFFFTLVIGPRRSLSLKLSDTQVYEPQIRRIFCRILTTLPLPYP